MSYSYTKTETFTITHARYLSSKVAADMHLCAQYYGEPSEDSIRRYAEEFAQYLKEGYISKYEFGYKKNGRRVVCWRYTVSESGTITSDDNAGKVVSFADIDGAVFYNFLWTNAKYAALSSSEQERFEAGLPVNRTAGSPPDDGNGYWTSDKNYSSAGVGLGRQTYRPL